jgi:hypothetical protein
VTRKERVERQIVAAEDAVASILTISGVDPTAAEAAYECIESLGRAAQAHLVSSEAPE